MINVSKQDAQSTERSYKETTKNNEAPILIITITKSAQKQKFTFGERKIEPKTIFFAAPTAKKRQGQTYFFS